MNISRREFAGLGLSAIIASGCASNIVRRRVGDKINIAFVGIGNQGRSDYREFMAFADGLNVVALCDTEIGGERTLDVLKDHPNVPRYRDFRRMFDRHGCELDAVVVATTDFSHFPIVIEAMRRGIAVFCEKPLGGTFRENEIIRRAALKYGVVTQMGNQGHSGANYYQCRDLVARGYVKDITRIVAHMGNVRRWHKWNGKWVAPPVSAPPKELDWNLWLAQRPFIEYREGYTNGDWRGFYPFGTGALGDWGAHIFDAAWEFLELGLPNEVEVRSITGHNQDVYPLSSTLAFRFPARKNMPSCVIEWYDGVDNSAPMPEGVTFRNWKRERNGEELYAADGRVFARGSHSSPMYLVAGDDAMSKSVRTEMRTYTRADGNHYDNFLRAVRGEKVNTSPFEIATVLCQVLALGCAAQQTGHGFKFDPVTMHTDDDDVNQILSGPPPRKGWEDYYRV